MKKILLIIFAVLGVVLFYNNNAYAETISGGIVNVQGIRGFTTYSQGQATYYGNQTWAEGWTIPSVILGSSGQWQKIYLNGVAYSVPNINLGDNSKKFNKYNFIINFKQQAYQGQPWTFQMHIPFYMSYVLSDGTSGEIQCKIGNYSSNEVEWNCGLSTDNYVIIKDLSIDWGAWKTIGSNPTEYYIAEIYSSATPPGTNVNANSIILQAWAYNVESTDDPMIAGQNTIINQNNTIINQNNQINQNIEDIHDAITDSNVSGNFNVNIMQGFGPIAGIVNGVLGIPQTILQVNACADIQAPLPFVNNNLQIPCMGQVLRNMAGGFITFADVILSAYLYFRLAIYIFRQVQQMRDPTNNKEDYLDL